MGLVFPKEDPDAEYLKTQGWSHKGPQLCRMWKHKFGGHHGGSPKDGMLTDIYPNQDHASHPMLRGVKPYQDPRHLYILLNEPGKTEYDFTHWSMERLVRFLITRSTYLKSNPRSSYPRDPDGLCIPVHVVLTRSRIPVRGSWHSIASSGH